MVVVRMLTKESVVEFNIVNLYNDVALNLMNYKHRPILGNYSLILVLLGLFFRTDRDKVIFVVHEESASAAIM